VIRPLIRAVGLAALAAAPAAAQSPEEPNLIITVTGGLALARNLWRVDRQPASVPNGTIGGGGDTLALARRLRPGITAALGAAVFRSPNFGYTLEAAFFGLASESRCAVVGTYAPDPENVNEQACTDAQGKHVPTNAAGFQAGLIYRFSARHVIQPHLRVSAGLALLGNSYVQTSGRVTTSTCPDCVRLLLGDRPKQTTWLMGVAAGVSLDLGPGYRLRAEARDLIIALPVATGPAPPDGEQVPPVGTVVRHIPVITAGLDVVLERRRTRRY
jgi:hypothetical protein